MLPIREADKKGNIIMEQTIELESLVRRKARLYKPPGERAKPAPTKEEREETRQRLYGDTPPRISSSPRGGTPARVYSCKGQHF